MSDTDRVRAHYDATPYPHVGVPALPGHWLDAGVATPPLRPGARVLVAGCGTGGEAAAYAAQVPGSTVVGVDLSPRSIEVARASGYGGDLTFDVADLAGDDLADRFAPFDFICCHAVADYVPDADALFRTLTRALAPGGVLYVGTNSEHHPGRRLRRTMHTLGLDASAWVEQPHHRAGLRVAHALLGPDVQIHDLPNQPAHLLGADVFPPWFHGMGLDGWTAAAEAAGLHLTDSLAAHFALPPVADADLPLLYRLDRPGLARLIEGLRRSAVLQLLFTNLPAPTPPWTEPASLWTWSAALHPAVGQPNLPVLSGDWMLPRFLGIAAPGLPELRIQLSAWLLELVRRCDGRASLAEVRASMPTPAHDEHLRSGLFRLWHAGLLRLVPPVA